MIFEKITKYIKKFFSNRNRNIILIIIAILLVIDIVLGLLSRFIILGLPDQLGAARWDYEGGDAQVSLFFTEDRKITPDDIKKLEYLLEDKMQKAGILPQEDEEETAASLVSIIDTIEPGQEYTDSSEVEKKPPVNKMALLYNSCYSAQGLSTIVFDNRKAENISTIGVEGDFFFFHPMELVSGSYFYADDIMKDKIVIDDYLAWDLFGSNDCIGMCVTIKGVNHYVAGVVRRPEGRINKAAGLNKSIVYMSYDSLSKYGEILSGKTESVEISEDGTSANIGGINCYEVVMPNNVEGLAAMLLKESAGLEDQFVNVVDNTNRFSFFSLLDVSASFGKRSMWDKPIFYPYWENVARGYEDILALINLIRTIFGVIIFFAVCVLVVMAYRNRTWTVGGIIRFLSDKKYEYEASRKRQLEDKA